MKLQFEKLFDWMMLIAYIVCPNTELSRMGYEKPSTKLTFYKAFFSPQWKFLIHIILQCMSAKRTSWNNFSSSMASVVICLSMGRKFNFSKVGNGFSGVETHLFEGMIVAQQDDDVVDDGAIGVNVDAGKQAGSQAQIYQIDLVNADKVLSTRDDELEPSELKEVVEVVTTAKLMTKVVTATSATITAATTPINAATITTAPSATTRRKEVVIRDPEETATPSIIIHSEPKSKDKGKGIMVEEPKPLKKQSQIEQDEAYVKELEAELNKYINLDDVIKQV
nr:hypothetical protein [Tanacetum cinerariifolium]